MENRFSLILKQRLSLDLTFALELVKIDSPSTIIMP